MKKNILIMTLISAIFVGNMSGMDEVMEIEKKTNNSNLKETLSKHTQTENEIEESKIRKKIMNEINEKNDIKLKKKLFNLEEELFKTQKKEYRIKKIEAAKYHNFLYSPLLGGLCGSIAANCFSENDTATQTGFFVGLTTGLIKGILNYTKTKEKYENLSHEEYIKTLKKNKSYFTKKYKDEKNTSKKAKLYKNKLIAIDLYEQNNYGGFLDYRQCYCYCTFTKYTPIRHKSCRYHYWYKENTN